MLDSQLYPTPKTTAVTQFSRKTWFSKWNAASLLMLLFAWGGFPSQAKALPRILRPGTKANAFYGGIGASTLIANGAYSSAGSFTVHHTIGHHFSGDSSGPALGGDLDLRLDGGFGFVIGPRFWWDIQVANMAIYVSPYVRAGLAMFLGGSQVTGALNFKLGARGKVILNDSSLLFIDLTGINSYLIFTSAGSYMFFEYQFLLGGGWTF